MRVNTQNLVHLLNASSTTIYMGTDTGPLFSLLADALQRIGRTPKTEGSFLVVDNHQTFLQFLRDLKSVVPVTAHAHNITVTFTTSGDTISLTSAMRTRTLADWYELVDGNFLISMMHENRFSVLFQPIVHAASQQIAGYECLLRGVDPFGNTVPPSALFSVAKSKGMSSELDEYARNLAITEFAKVDDGESSIFVNFTPNSIYTPKESLAKTVQLTKELGIAPERIVFEVVEWDYLSNIDHLSEIIDFFKDSGFRTALDDFGNEMSNRGMLLSMGPDIIKVDPRLINNFLTDEFSQIKLMELLSRIEEFGLETLAEGVDSQEKAEALAEIGVTYLQGFYCGKLMSKI